MLKYKLTYNILWVILYFGIELMLSWLIFNAEFTRNKTELESTLSKVLTLKRKLCRSQTYTYMMSCCYCSLIFCEACKIWTIIYCSRKIIPQFTKTKFLFQFMYKFCQSKSCYLQQFYIESSEEAKFHQRK